MPRNLGFFQTFPVVTALPTSSGSGRVVTLSTDGHPYFDHSTGWQRMDGAGGDMTKAVYDVNNDGKIDVGALGTGTPSTSTYLRGDGAWATPVGGSSALDASNNLLLPATTTQSTPTTGEGLAAVSQAGKATLQVKAADGWADEAGAALWQDVAIAAPGSPPALTFIGSSSNVSNAAGSSAGGGGQAATSYRTTLPRTSYATGTTAGTYYGLRFANPIRFRGGAAGIGGFDVVIRFALTISSGHITAVGLTTSGSLASNADPSSYFNSVLLGADAADTTLQWMTRGASGVATKIDTGLAKTTNDALRARFYCAPNASAIGVRLWDETTGALVHETSLTATLPPSTTGLYANLYIGNAASASNAVFEFVRMYSAAPTR